MNKYILARLRPDGRVAAILFDFQNGKDQFDKEELTKKYNEEVAAERIKGLTVLKAIDIKDVV